MCAVGWVIPDQMEMTELDQIDCYDDFKEYVARAEEMSSELSELAAPVSMADLHEETVSLFGAYGRLPILESCGEEFPAFEDSACQEVISAMNTSFSTTSEFLDRWQPYI